MKNLLKAAPAIFAALTACAEPTANVTDPDQVEAAYEQQAEGFENVAEKATSDRKRDVLTNRAEDVREAGRERADTLREEGSSEP